MDFKEGDLVQVTTEDLYHYVTFGGIYEIVGSNTREVLIMCDRGWNLGLFPGEYKPYHISQYHFDKSLINILS